ncbi:hypothetical protein F5B22DRAFT_652120 [Xylaria bambusicola]|uniref:uncharacterized protein n=1 Tax=Xylaria bambusicola TaxID=326684 RepID=UPI002007C439|nr:uncharacterized protein F5B22DRAFT_652120 [Xylaria bambusicola]KAI0503406.1 hypothetical protein F5B22DRAFT_652120 [Xylaria bambusicola]
MAVQGVTISGFMWSPSSASLAAGHIALENPKPYKLVADGATNPLLSSGADFPCRIPPGKSYIIDGEPTEMVIGEDQTLSFSGHAVHSGGSCQLALSRGFPTKDSPWKVIHSIEGGCPARNVKGNLDGEDQDKYIFQIPEGIEPGTNWTLSWTWNNAGGSAEMYMACSPITILPSKKKRMSLPERRDALAKRETNFPELFVANLGEFSNGCSTSEAVKDIIAIAYPDPGSSVERPNGDNLFKMTCNGNPRAKGAPAAGAGGDGSAETETPKSSSSSSASSSTVPSSSASKSPVSCPPLTPPSSTAAATTTTGQASTTGSLIPITSSFSVSPSPGTSAMPSSESHNDESSSATTLFPIPSASTSIMPSASQDSSLPSEGSKCVEGHLTCLDNGLFFATCTGGQLTAHQPIAPGYKCEPGSGVGLEIAPM